MTQKPRAVRAPRERHPPRARRTPNPNRAGWGKQPVPSSTQAARCPPCVYVWVGVGVSARCAPPGGLSGVHHLHARHERHVACGGRAPQMKGRRSRRVCTESRCAPARNPRGGLSVRPGAGGRLAAAAAPSARPACLPGALRASLCRCGVRVLRRASRRAPEQKTRTSSTFTFIFPGPSNIWDQLSRTCGGDRGRAHQRRRWERRRGR